MLRQHESFAGYLIEGVLGQGGMGTVYLARHPRLPRLVALKLLNRAVSEDQELRRRFEQEANVVARLEHPSIVGVYDRGADNGHLWISMQYIRGTDATRLDPRAASPGHIVGIVRDTATALDYAHGRGVLHRDIKPANILIAEPEAGRESRALLTDFGIARLLDADTKLTATGTFTATLAYASPEQLSGEPVDHRADQYSLGCTLYTLLAGHPPFPSTNPGQIVAGHIAKPVPRLSDTRPELPRRLDDVIARAMAKRRDERFASCGDFAMAAAAALRGEDPGAWAAPARTVVNQRSAHPVAAEDPWPRSGPPAFHEPSTSVPRAEFGSAARPLAPVGDPQPSAFAARIGAVIGLGVGVLVGLLVAGAVVRWAARRSGGHGRAPQAPAIDFLVPMMICSVWSLLLIGGSLALFAGRRAGRIAVALGTGILTLLGVIAVAASLGNSLAEVVFSGTILLVAFTGSACTLSPSTGRWIAHKRSRTR
ncbi:serine/threonine-protein kinase [Nocardia asteroides]